MKKWISLIICCLLIILAACKTTRTTTSDVSVEDSLREKNKMSIPLLSQINRLPGVTIQNGVPVFTKKASSVFPGASSEPLYVLDGYVVGNSFRSLNQLVKNVNVESIKALSDSDASIYGSRGGKGVIILTTYQ